MGQVGIVMGSISDWETLQHTCDTLDEFGITYEKEVMSAHRTPEDMFEYAKTAKERGISVIIAGAGGAAHLPGMVASLTTLPVIGVPIQTKARSEEHTSELQSRGHIVCRLLLEKKKY